jgi:hypothetical protein
VQKEVLDFVTAMKQSIKIQDLIGKTKETSNNGIRQNHNNGRKKVRRLNLSKR